MSRASDLNGWRGEAFEEDAADETAVLCYSSGTVSASNVGKGKADALRRLACQKVPASVESYFSAADALPGVMTTHRNLIAQQTIFSQAMVKLSPEQADKALGLLPFSRESNNRPAATKLRPH